MKGTRLKVTSIYGNPTATRIYKFHICISNLSTFLPFIFKQEH